MACYAGVVMRCVMMCFVTALCCMVYCVVLIHVVLCCGMPCVVLWFDALV